MGKYLCVILMSISLSALATKLPKGFTLNSGQAVYVDFISASYNITYDIPKEKAYAYSRISFYQSMEGYPIFDLVPVGYGAAIDGKSTEILQIKSPGNQTTYKSLTTKISKGYHTLTLRNEISENVSYSDGGVQGAFWMSDLRDREFLEQYLPTNLEYDRYRMELDIHFIGGSAPQTFFTNGKVTTISNTHYKIEFPNHFTSSSLYFHTATLNRFYGKQFTLKSINGKTIPVYIYSRFSGNVWNAWRETLKHFNELERNYGAWPHPLMLIYVAGRGGMEFCGSTITSLKALGHELTHSFFGRGVMPFNGDSGWIDEAIATWRGKEYPVSSKPFYTWSNMGNRSIYMRSTDRVAYTKGSSFVSYINYQLLHKGGLKAFLRHFFQKYQFNTITSETFRKELENWSGIGFSWDFSNYIYGNGFVNEAYKDVEIPEENPFHPELSKEDLAKLL